jgi:dCMP deaminase|tara:strand:+ start:32343 stop:32822 length:480 start_codon:yes stop_codon:yes gene_type:complete
MAEIKTSSIDWDGRFLNLAQLVSSWSKDPSTKVGSVIVDESRRVISVGYNGFPKGVRDSQHRLDDRELKYNFMVHAERNAIIFSRGSLENSTIYTYPFMPCSHCAGMIIQSGIKRVVTFYDRNPRWAKSFDISKKMFLEAAVDLTEYNKNFFLKVDNNF